MTTPKTVAVGGMGILASFACVSLWSSFMTGEYYAVPAIGGLLLGGIAVLLGTLAGEIAPHHARISGTGGGQSKADLRRLP